MAFGAAGEHDRGTPDGTLAVPIVALAAGFLLMLGVWMPLPLFNAIARAAAVLGAHP